MGIIPAPKLKSMEILEEIKDIKKGGNTIIIAPHYDDEIIGCYEILKSKRVFIIYTSMLNDNMRKEESLKIKEHFDIKGQIYTRQIPSNLLDKENKFYFPDPIYETHPSHRLEGMVGESFARDGFDVTFYSTNMTAPYIHEAENPFEKESMLNKCYPSQKSLWKFEKKFVLFEGYCKWIF